LVFVIVVLVLCSVTFTEGDELLIICKELVTVFLSFVRVVLMRKKNAALITTNNAYYIYGKFAYNVIILIIYNKRNWLWLMVPLCYYNFHNSVNQYKVIHCNTYSFMMLAKIL